MADNNSVNSGVLGGYGCAVFFAMEETPEKKMKIGSYRYHTGLNLQGKNLHIASELPVAVEGTFSASLETTMQGDDLEAFLKQYLSMYTNPTALRAGSSAEELIDEAGRGKGENGAPTPINEMLFAIFWGGEYIQKDADAATENTAYRYIRYALIKVNNDTNSRSFKNGTYMRTPLTLSGVYPANDIKMILNDNALKDANGAIDIGLNIVGDIELKLQKDLQVDNARVKVKYPKDE